MNKTPIYIVVAVLAIFLMIGLYFYLKLSLDQIKEKTIAGIVEFREYVMMLLEKTLNDPKNGMSVENNKIWKVVFLNNKNNTSNANKKATDVINALTNKDLIYEAVTAVVNELRTVIIIPLVSNLSDKKIIIDDFNKKADDLLKKLKF